MICFILDEGGGGNLFGYEMALIVTYIGVLEIDILNYNPPSKLYSWSRHWPPRGP